FVSLDVVDNVLDGADFLGVLVRDLHPVLLLQRHHQLDDIQRVRPEVLDKRRIRSHFVSGHTELLADYLANLGFDFSSHRYLLSSCRPAPRRAPETLCCSARRIQPCRPRAADHPSRFLPAADITAQLKELTPTRQVGMP